jgi:hypothetical protein
MSRPARRPAPNAESPCWFPRTLLGTVRSRLRRARRTRRSHGEKLAIDSASSELRRGLSSCFRRTGHLEGDFRRLLKPVGPSGRGDRQLQLLDLTKQVHTMAEELSDTAPADACPGPDRSANKQRNCGMTQSEANQPRLAYNSRRLAFLTTVCLVLQMRARQIRKGS